MEVVYGDNNIEIYRICTQSFSNNGGLAMVTNHFGYFYRSDYVLNYYNYKGKYHGDGLGNGIG